METVFDIRDVYSKKVSEVTLSRGMVCVAIANGKSETYIHIQVPEDHESVIKVTARERVKS